MDEITEALTQLAILVATGVITYAVKKYRDWVNANTDEKQRKAINDALLNSIKWAKQQVELGVMPSQEQIVREAATYMYANVSGIIEALKLDKDSIIKLIEARL